MIIINAILYNLNLKIKKIKKKLVEIYATLIFYFLIKI